MESMHATRDKATQLKAEAQEPVALERPSVSPAMQSAELTVQADAADGRVVQGKGGLEATDVQAAAQQGVTGPGRALPHLEAVQQAFGKHDVTGVGAHVGGAAEAACEDIGARAYATGNQVAFKSDPDLHTAAHEAAHVVQQRAGVHLKGGVGEAGDRYEQHADAVADRVVQGKNAEDLLDEMAGGGSTPGVQKAGEEPGAWLQQQQLTANSFIFLVDRNVLAAESWKGRAEVEDPPPFWQQALLAVGGLVLNAALGGVAGALTSRLVQQGTKFVVDAAIQTAIKIGENAATTGVNAAVTAASGAGDKKPLVAFCEQQKIALVKSGKAASERFITDAGTFTDQKLTIAQMAEIKKANDDAFEQATAIQNHEMLVGWMGMQAGNTTDPNATEENVQDIDNNGILRLTINGAGDKPFRIIGASAAGLNEGLRGDLKDTKLRDWRKGAIGKNGKPRTNGIDVLVTTGLPSSKADSYQVSDATWNRIAAAGKAPNSFTSAGMNKAIFFSFFAERTGKTTWTDTDMDWSHDYNWGADAGRWFLENVKSTYDIMAMLDNLTIPEVSG